jgi:hypothetical protein
MKLKKTINSIMILFILIGLSIILINNVVFIHIHKLEDGKVISHAHPFNKSEKTSSGEAKHQHTDNEIQIYQILNYVLLVLILFSTTAIIYRKINKIKHLFFEYYNVFLNFETFLIRPPPVNS